MKKQIKSKDLIWILAYPVYQIIGTFRHESAHAIFALLEGVRINKFIFWPTIVNGQFKWGYVAYGGHVSWLTTFSPCLIDLITFIIFYLIISRVFFKHRWIWINLVIIGLVSPFVNSLYQYIIALRGSYNDVGMLLNKGAALSYFTHAYFIITLIIYIIGIYFAIFKKKRAEFIFDSE